jgi:hypothetical protein
MDEAASPDEYFCEECRKDLHKVMTSPKGCVQQSPYTCLQFSSCKLSRRAGGNDSQSRPTRRFGGCLAAASQIAIDKLLRLHSC